MKRYSVLAVFGLAVAIGLGARALAIDSRCSAHYAPSGVVEGCWVELWESDNFTDSCLVLQGPAERQNMRIPNIKDWGDEIDSIRVGPKAKVEAWEDEKYEDRKVEFGPDSETGKLDDQDFGDEIDSLKVTCQ